MNEKSMLGIAGGIIVLSVGLLIGFIKYYGTETRNDLKELTKQQGEMREDIKLAQLQMKGRIDTNVAAIKAVAAMMDNTVDDRPNGATHVRSNGATLKWQKQGSRRAIKLAFFTPFRNSIFKRYFAA